MEKSTYLVCVDSDGCAINSMNCKHTECFGPAILQTWNVKEGGDEILKRWNQINLFSATRGVNRFIGLSMILKEFRLETDEDAEEFRRWTENAPELSNRALKEISDRGENSVYTRALQWSLCVNEKIEGLSVPKSFEPVKRCIETIHKAADISVVSSANKEAILTEWETNGLLEQTDYVFSQSDGSKEECIRTMRNSGYKPEHILMVGDAPGDYQAAAANHVWFYPILAGKEEESWRRLEQTYFGLFIQNMFDESVQRKLKEEMERNLQADH